MKVETSCLNISLAVQVVQDIPSPIPLDIPMALIKPQEACSTAEVYKVILSQEFEIVTNCFLH